ncbi:MAG: CBS domain-containing protein [Candidatus Omnitrophota bacterium]
MKINEIMTKKVRTLSPEDLVVDAIQILFDHKISGLPVIDVSKKLVGMFTEKDVLKGILPSYVSQVGSFVYENSPKTIKTKVSKLAGFTVGQLMRKEVVKVLQDTPVCEVARMMLTQNVRRIPVVDADDHILGIAARSDVLENILNA